MACKHILSLEVPNTSNCDVFTISDASTYCKDMQVDCPQLEITAPGFASPKLIKMNIVKNETGEWNTFGSINFNACNLGLTTQDCSSTRSIVGDGLYIIKYSLSPHDKVYVEYNHLRTSGIMSAYYQKLCSLQVKPCEPSSDKVQLLSEMKYIRTLIDAAKAKVEYCNSPNEGMELYNYAYKKLKKITCEICC
tara:strand:- start:450 stop:1028 length:579 start_codon:yes stop_codon:yes gene_type:complete